MQDCGKGNRPFPFFIPITLPASLVALVGFPHPNSLFPALPLADIRVVTSEQSAARDQAAITAGTPSRALMQRAGAATAAEVAWRFRKRLRTGALVFAG